MVIYGNYKQTSGAQGLSFLLNHVNKTIDTRPIHIKNKNIDHIKYDTLYDNSEIITIKESVKVEEHVLV